MSKLQAQIDALVRVPCPDCAYGWFLTKHGKLKCTTCNGSGLAPKYDCLRLECKGDFYEELIAERPMQWVKVYFHTHGQRDEDGVNCECRDKKYTTLPAERAHETVGKLLLTSQFDLQYLWQGDESPPLWTVNNWEKEIPYMSSATPEEALMSALCQAEGVRDGY